MAAYILRNIDPALWSRVKAMSEAEGIPLRAVILKLLELYGLGEVVIRADKGNDRQEMFSLLESAASCWAYIASDDACPKDERLAAERNAALARQVLIRADRKGNP